MGGGHHHEPFIIPKYTIYNDYQKFPELLAHEKKLAQLGLKDPWIRNYVYLYDRKYPHVVGQWAHFKKLIMPGWKAGVGAAALLITAEELYQYAYMSALEAFVNEQKKKSGGITSGIGSASFSSLGDLKNKLSSSISALPLLSRSEADTESLTGEFGDGQLPQSKNRKSSGWFSSDESVFGLSRTQRIVAFFMCMIGAMFCFSTAMFLIPVIIVSTRKFAALNTLGSVMLLLSFSFLWGPRSYVQHLLSEQRRLVTVCYFSALFATLYSSLWLQSTIFTLLASIFQGFSLLWFVMSYVPGGERGLRFITSLFAGFIKRSPTTVLPI